MTTLTVTAKGQVTLRKDFLRHLGVRPGDKITVEKRRNGEISVKAASGRQHFGCLRPAERGLRPSCLD